MAIKLIILLILAHQFHAVASVILKGTPISTHPYGSKVKLTCVKEDGALVWTTSTGDILFNEEARYSKDEKYDNFKVDISGNQSSMIITNALSEDEGEYSCSDTISKATIQVNIEVAPRLRISYGGRQDPRPHLPSSSSSSISITCLAEGAKPEVSIRFKVGESDWLSPTNNEIAPNGLLFDTNATLNFQFIDDPNGNVVTCETSGQSSINPIAETQTLMTPNCNLEMNSTEATCNCASNPPVYKYILSIDGKMQVGKTLNVENLGGSNISCFGVNYIGVGTYSSIVLESRTDSSFPVYVIVIVVVLFAVVVIALVVVYRRRKKHNSHAIKSSQPLGETPKDSKDTELPESALPEQNHLLSEDSNEKSEQNTKDIPEKGDGSPCADRKPTDNSNVVAQEKEKLLAQSSPAEPERSQIPGNKASKHENNEKGSSDKSGSSPGEHNHGRLKSTAGENLNAQRDNQHGAAGTPTDSENKKQPHAGFAVTGTINQSHASPEHSVVQSAQRGNKEASNRAKNKEENKKDENKDELKEKFRAVTGNVFQSDASAEQSAVQSAQREQSNYHQEAVNKTPQHNTGQETKEDIGDISRQSYVGKIKARFESPQLQLQPDSGSHSKAEESEDSTNITENLFSKR